MRDGDLYHGNFIISFFPVKFDIKSAMPFFSFNYCRLEAESLQHLSAKYCALLPPPRSTIAAAFSPDGRTLASTQSVSPRLHRHVQSVLCYASFVSICSI